MSIHSYLEKMKNMQNNLLEFIEKGNIEEKYQKLIDLFTEYTILENRHELKSILYLIVKIANNHHRSPHFFTKICKILLFFVEEMKKYFSNYEIFNIFKSNKRLLLFLIEDKIITMDKSIAYTITNDKYKDANYLDYFLPEIEKFVDKNTLKKSQNQIQANFKELRRIGENDNYICELIRNDSIDEFVEYVNKNQIQLSSTIEPSIFETNPLIIKNEPTLIEYAAFFGSIRIFEYLFQNEVKMTPFLWNYSIHSNKLELIQLLESNHIKPKKDDCEDCLKECIKCHHTDIENYIKENFMKNTGENHLNYFFVGLKYYNFVHILIENINESEFYDLCHYDYFILVEILLKIKDIDINSKIIQIMIFSFSFELFLFS